MKVASCNRKFSYKMADTAMGVNKYKDLSIIVTSDVNFSKQYLAACSKANKMHVIFNIKAKVLC